jgi:hypothetical protein
MELFIQCYVYQLSLFYRFRLPNGTNRQVTKFRFGLLFTITNRYTLFAIKNVTGKLQENFYFHLKWMIMRLEVSGEF